MFQPSELGAPASTNSFTHSTSTQTGEYEELRHLLFGSVRSINSTVHFLHKRGYAEPNDWSKPMPTGRGDEWMTLLVKRVPLE